MTHLYLFTSLPDLFIVHPYHLQVSWPKNYRLNHRLSIQHIHQFFTVGQYPIYACWLTIGRISCIIKQMGRTRQTPAVYPQDRTAFLFFVHLLHLYVPLQPCWGSSLSPPITFPRACRTTIPQGSQSTMLSKLVAVKVYKRTNHSYLDLNLLGYIL